MPVTTKTRRPVRHTEGFTTTYLRSHADRPVRVFVPSDYQPKYAYPLVILFHADGADEDSAARLVSRLSRRNYVVACPRGGVSLGAGADGRRGYAWGDAFKNGYLADLLAHAREKYHIHTRRAYLVGVGEGAAVAYRFGLELGEAVGGVVALNGELPLAQKKPRCGMQLFLGHGANNSEVPVAVARRASRVLSTAGSNVRFQTYATAKLVTDEMLRDVNRWIMGTVNAGPDWLGTANA